MLSDIPVFLSKSKRMRRQGITAYIRKDGVHISYSYGVTKEQVNIFLEDNKEKIVNSYNNVLEMQQNLLAENKVMYRGKILDLVYMFSSQEYVELQDGKIVVHIKEENKKDTVKIKNLLKSFLAVKLQSFLEVEVVKYAKQMNVSFNRISIKDNKTNYGSCSSNKNLNFNLRLMQMDENVASYIVCHEVSHLLYMNHSKAFWRNVEMFYGDYKKAKKWLRNNSKFFI